VLGLGRHRVARVAVLEQLVHRRFHLFPDGGERVGLEQLFDLREQRLLFLLDVMLDEILEDLRLRLERQVVRLQVQHVGDDALDG